MQTNLIKNNQNKDILDNVFLPLPLSTYFFISQKILCEVL